MRLREWAVAALDDLSYWTDCVLSLVATDGKARSGAHAVTVYFHGIVRQPGDGAVDPQERITPGFLRSFIRRMKGLGYTFVTPDALQNLQRPAGNLAILSSDDGYRSVEDLVPVLEEEGAPLSIYVITEYAERDAACWWDQIYRAGRSDPATRALLKHGARSRRERDAALRMLGVDPSGRPRSESQRLLSPQDIRRLSSDRHFCIGNHTRNHLSLPLLCDPDLQDEVEGARAALERWTGRTIRHFALPYGDHDERTLTVLCRAGYRTVMTTEPGHFDLGADAVPQATAVLPRYRLRGDRSPAWQARIMSRGITVGFRIQTGVRRWVKRGLA